MRYCKVNFCHKNFTYGIFAKSSKNLYQTDVKGTLPINSKVKSMKERPLEKQQIKAENLL